jgi:hypothetical protein
MYRVSNGEKGAVAVSLFGESDAEDCWTVTDDPDRRGEVQALEPLPTVRRILINGDTKHNYIKRNASLGLRTNGVYQVFGTHEKGEVEWKFEYVVEDRRAEATGKAISGERVSEPAHNSELRLQLT